MIVLKPNLKTAKWMYYMPLIVFLVYAFQSFFRLVCLEKDFVLFYETKKNYEALKCDLQVHSYLDILLIIVNIISIIFLTTWYYRAYYNLHLIKSNLFKPASAAAWSWFVPVVNFYYPYIISHELYLFQTKILTDNNIEIRRKLPTILLKFWWISLVIVNTVSIFFTIYFLFFNNSGANRLKLYFDVRRVEFYLLAINLILFFIVFRYLIYIEKLLHININKIEINDKDFEKTEYENILD